MREQHDRVPANFVRDSNISRFINPYQRRNPTSSPGSAFSFNSLFNVSASKQEGQNSDAHTASSTQQSLQYQDCYSLLS
jgi:hypothetical protein